MLARVTLSSTDIKKCMTALLIWRFITDIMESKVCRFGVAHLSRPASDWSGGIPSFLEFERGGDGEALPSPPLVVRCVI